MALNFKVASRNARISYPIREMASAGKKLEDAGRRIIKLNIGDPDAYDFDAPADARTAACAAINSHKNHYADSQGEMRLRKVIVAGNASRGFTCTPENTFVTHGLSEAVNMLYSVLLEPGDNVLAPSPCYTQYEMLAHFYGAEPRLYECSEELDFAPDVDALRKLVDSKTKAICVINPNNPTGALYPEKTLREIIGVAGEQGIPILADEIYDEMVLDGAKHTPIASIAKDVPVAAMNGASKNVLATGWRVGWFSLCNFPQEFSTACLQLSRLRLGVNLPFQLGVASALENKESHAAEVKKMTYRLSKRRDLAHKRLNEIPGLTCVKPLGAFYAFPKIEDAKGVWKADKEFCLELLEKKGVLTVFGGAFGQKPGTKHFRIVFLPPEAVLNEALDKTTDFMKEKGV